MHRYRLAAPASLPRIAFLVILLTWTFETEAEELDAGASPHRDGLLIGASFGRGSIDVECRSCGDLPRVREALSVAAHLGYMFTPRLGLLGEHWSVRYNGRGGAWFDDSVEHLVAQHMSMAAVQVFVTDSLWLKAGLGVGWHISDGDYTQKAFAQGRPAMASFKATSRPDARESSETLSPASFAALGWEFAHDSSFAAEIQFRVGATRRTDDLYQVYTSAFNVGCSWY